MSVQFDDSDPIHGDLWANFPQADPDMTANFPTIETSSNIPFDFDQSSGLLGSGLLGSGFLGSGQLLVGQDMLEERVEACGTSFIRTQEMDTSGGGLHILEQALHPFPSTKQMDARKPLAVPQGSGSYW